MIGFIEGTVRALRDGYAIVSVGGIGYKVFATHDTLSRVSKGDIVAMWTHLAVRENALDLYGFAAEEDVRFFELLLTVSGIGPKSALAILDISNAETLRDAIIAGNAAYLTTISGIGRKTAEKIVIELRDKIDVDARATPASSALAGDAEALEAMKSLGYSAQEARDILRKVPRDITGASERLREALRIAGK